MDELLQMAKLKEPLWVFDATSLEGCKTETSYESAIVKINYIQLIEAFMKVSILNFGSTSGSIKIYERTDTEKRTSHHRATKNGKTKRATLGFKRGPDTVVIDKQVYVTWIEHIDVDNNVNEVVGIYKPQLDSSMTFRVGKTQDYNVGSTT
nr:homeobox-leucine zipper protein HDG2-like isoform X1 [Ipomoea batatas]